MNQQYETANITYKGLEDKGLTVQIIDQDKKKWTVWKKAYQSQEDSDVWTALQNFKFGDTFGVSYQEKDESFTGKDGKLINFKRKTIYSILPTISHPTSAIKTSKSTSQTYTPTKETEPVDWDEIAVGKCQTVFLQAYIQSGKTFEDAKLQVIPARRLAEMVVYGQRKTEDDEAPLPEQPPF